MNLVRIWKLSGLLAAMAVLFAGCSGKNAEKTLGESIVIDDIDVSGLTLTEAERRVEESHQYRDRAEILFRVVLDERSVLLYGEHLPLEYNTESVVREAAELSRWALPGDPARSFSCERVLDMEKAAELCAPRLELLNTAAQEPRAEYAPEADGAFLFYAGTEGKTIRTEAVMKQIAERISGEDSAVIAAEYDLTAPKETMEDLRARWTLVSEFTTEYGKSPLNASGRVHNIKKAAEMIDGYLLEPGEEFDMNAVLGDRVAGKGWKKAPGIRDGKYEMEYGGGVCQVSGTLFNAVMMADLPVTERHTHSWPLTYIPIGRDATISTGGPNFKFRNDRDTPTLISAQTDAKAKSVTVKIYGAPLPDGVSIRIASERTGSIPDPGEEILLDASLAPNTRRVERKSRAGKLSVTYKDYYDEDGSLIRRVTAYEDKYRPIRGIVYVSEDLYQKSS